ncbi:N-acetylmuramoyl-L-alanine amidase [Paenibacillus cellulosilyticus]|uniref:N-acetylmuramoyl-L-alanine amidase n=1 Tax=Paenibacillus cellulosilyticus TaxID=375489 RepID=A0A2V2YVU3_9BACL|nr:N-acetylmuramoyl-L-alanine amidase [Paenibacillus cellulosilyticus]PWV95177.1 N-acetylmuramoyl-L-alanine amidase [Paenibacillus cellulosilyticus]QKS46069.1 N-acetylmuramoyl-L-alanine amidase [Paenibacillus cellulosilyticus]
MATGNDSTARNPILGTSVRTKDELVQFVKKVNPAFKEEIAAAFLSIGAKYGVRGDVAFVQSIHETNWFRFGGDVKAEQNNFAGLGATGGVAGNSFPTITAGVTAQIQHLYAYATSGSLPAGETVIDTRFGLVTRGSAKNWEDLAGTWAVPGYDKTKYSSLTAAMQAGDSYGQNIIKLYATIPAAIAPVATGPIVVLDAGHGGTDSGAQGFGIVEKDRALSIALKVRDRLLSKYVVQVKMTRDTDIFIPLKERAEMANNWKADYFVSLHHNASGGRGFESYVYNGTRAQESGKKQDVVHAAIMAYLSTVGVNDRGKKEANFAVIRETKMPAILIENLFVDQADDAALLNNAAVVDKLCDAIALGIGQALQLAAVPVVTTPAEPEVPTTSVPDVTSEYPTGTPQWRIDAVEWLYTQGLLTDKSWKMKLNDPLPLWAEATMLKRMYEKLSTK